MWWTERGERVLRGSEWELFRRGLGELWDWVDDEEDSRDSCDSGVEAFDRLQKNQKLALMAGVGVALRDEAVPCPDLTVNTESTVAAVYSIIANEVLSEIGHSDEPAWETAPDPLAAKTHWRRLVLAAYLEAELDEQAEAPAGRASKGGRESEHGLADPPDVQDEDEPDESWSPPDAASKDEEDWEFLVHRLANRILWEDGDYDAGRHFLDADPAESRLRMES